jgi:ADYC domain
MSRIITLLASTAIAGCVVGTDNFASVEQNGIMPNGIMPNGIMPNGIMPNGIMPNGIMPNGIMPNDIRLNGIMPNGIMPNGTLIGVSGTGAPLSGADLVGSQWTGQLSDGSALAIRIDEAAPPTSANGDLWSYRFSARVNNEWRALCTNPDGEPIFADTVGGTWNLEQGVPGGGSYHPNDAQFTIACRGSAIAKCVELGYKPWHGFATQLATCVRALRADFCGDGTPHTVNGTMINLYDNVGIQADTVDWIPEAEWTPDGATCVSKKKNTRFDQVVNDHPTCYPGALKPEKSCGTGFSGGAAIITELAPM